MARKSLFYHLQGATEGYTLFTSTDKQNIAVARLFRDSNGDAVSFEDPGDWSVAYNLEYGDRASGYQLRAVISKKITDPPTRIHQKIAELVRSMLRSGPCGAR